MFHRGDYAQVTGLRHHLVRVIDVISVLLVVTPVPLHNAVSEDVFRTSLCAGKLAPRTV